VYGVREEWIIELRRCRHLNCNRGDLSGAHALCVAINNAALRGALCSAAVDGRSTACVARAAPLQLGVEQSSDRQRLFTVCVEPAADRL